MKRAHCTPLDWWGARNTSLWSRCKFENLSEDAMVTSRLDLKELKRRVGSSLSKRRVAAAASVMAKADREPYGRRAQLTRRVRTAGLGRLIR